MRSRFLSKINFVSCVGYFDRAYYGFRGEQNLTKPDSCGTGGGGYTYTVYPLMYKIQKLI